MALFKCVECGNEVSTTAKTCPKCGAKVTAPKKPASKLWLALGAVVIGGMVIGAMRPTGADGSASPGPAKSPEQLAKDKAASAKRDEQLQAAAAGAAALKGAMKDPTAFELTSLVVKPNGVGCYEYRAKNSFGAIMPGSAVLAPNGKLLVQEKNGNTFATAWNKDCTAPGGDDVTALAKKLGIV